MIQANELRVGNYIIDEDDVIVKVVGINNEKEFYHDKLNHTFKGTVSLFYNDWRGNIGRWIEKCKPIELTSYIISKTHFYYDSDSESFQISDCTLKLYDYDDDGFMCVIFGNESHFINHLHQLQNLYFALTGKELEINL